MRRLQVRKTRRPVHMGMRVATVLAVLAGFLITPPLATAATITTGQGFARGQALQLDATVANVNDPSDPYETRGDVSRCESEIDSGGIGLGDIVAEGFGDPLAADTDGLQKARFAESSSHFPTAENLPDTANKANAQVQGILAASTLESESNATGMPRSENNCSVQTAQLLPAGDPSNPPPLVQTEVLSSSSTSEYDGPTTTVTSHAESAVNETNAFLPATSPVQIRAATAVADAQVDGTTGTASASCEVVVVDVLGIPIEPFDCDPSENFTVGPFVTVEFGTPLNDGPDGPTSASAGIIAVRVTVDTPVADPIVLQLGIAEASAALTEEEEPPPPPCDVPVVEEPTSSGSARGYVSRFRDLQEQFEVDSALSEVAIDEARLPVYPDTGPPALGPYSAEAAGLPLQVEAFPAPSRGTPPVDSSDVIEVVDSRAQSPDDDSESHTVANVDAAVPPPPSDLLTLQAEAVSSEATTSTAGPGDLRDPHAAAAALIDHIDTTADLPGGAADVPFVLDQIQSSATSDKNPSDVTSTSSENLTTLDTSIAGIPIHVEAIVTPETFAQATATDGDARTAFTIVGVTVAGQTIALPADPDGDGESDRAPDETDVVVLGQNVATVLIGEINVDTGPGFAHIEAIPVRILVPGNNTGGAKNELTLGFTEAHAVFNDAEAANLVVTKEVDIHHQYVDGQIAPEGTWDDDGANVVPHQKYWHRICVGNASETATIEDVVVFDDFGPNVRIVMEPPGPPAGFTVAGRTITSTVPFDVPPGGEVVFEILVEVDRSTKLTNPPVTIPNTAIATPSGGAPVPSNTTQLFVRLDPDQPALSLGGAAPSTCDTANRILTGFFRVRNSTGAGTATDVLVDQVAIQSPPGVTLLSPLPVALGTIPAGGKSATFPLQFSVPGAPGTPCPRVQAIFRETGTGPDGHLYAFD